MTLIAGFMKNDCPILIGDLLISNTKESSDELVIPTVGKISPHTFQNGIFRPSAFSQKVNLLSPKLALAWSGNLLEAKEFMGQLIGAGLHNAPSRESILEIYNDLSPNELSVIGLLRDGEDLILFDINAIQVNARDPSIKWFKASGTGYGRLLNINHDLHSANISGNLNKLEVGISTAVRITTSLVTLELETALPLQELFGAGYEILHPLGSGLAKFEDLTYYFWTVNEIEPQIWGLSLPFLAMKYSYHDDILIIRSVRLSSDKSTNLPMIDSDELHIIKPIYRMVNDNELVGYSPASLNSKMMCNVFLSKNLAGQTETFSTFGRYTQLTTPIIWNNEFKSKGGVYINQDFLKETMTKITLRFNST